MTDATSPRSPSSDDVLPEADRQVVDLQRYRLSDVEHALVFRQEIVPRHLSGLVAQDRPVAVFVAGQPGAGKSTTAQTVLRTLAPAGGAAHVCGDFYKPHHPRYDELLQKDPLTAGAFTRLDARAWHADAETYARAHRAHTVIETALATPAAFAEPATAFRAAGYVVEVVILAVPEALSRLGILARYAMEHHVTGGRAARWVDVDNHDTCYAASPVTAAAIDQERTADQVRVVSRDLVTRYANELDSAGGWVRPPDAAAAILTTRAMPWTAEQTAEFDAMTARLMALGVRGIGQHLDAVTALATSLRATPAEQTTTRRVGPSPRPAQPGPSPRGRPPEPPPGRAGPRPKHGR